MAKFVRGDVVVVVFPFSDLSQTKKRPALIIAEAIPSDFILCQITSQASKDARAVVLKDSDFESGELKQDSYLRPNRLFTANDKIILYKAGHLKTAKLNSVIDSIIQVIRNS